MGVREVLTEARRLLCEVGWVQGTYASAQGLCLQGAINVASGEMRLLGEHEAELLKWGRVTYVTNGQGKRSFDAMLATTAASRIVTQHIPAVAPAVADDPLHVSIPWWNDRPDTTKDDVLAVLDNAIASC